MFEIQPETKLFILKCRNDEEEVIIHHSSLKRCYYPLCTFTHSKHNLLIDHLEKRHNAKNFISTLGWFWVIIKMNIAINPYLSIKDLLKENRGDSAEIRYCKVFKIMKILSSFSHDS
jgi:hypothetical protein